MKRFITIAILLLPALAACNKNNEGESNIATSVVLSRDKVDLQVGETVTLTANVLPAALNMGVVWSVLDEEYASVTDGTITGLAEGVTYVIATSADGNQKAACMVSVNPEVKYSVSIKDDFGLPLSGIYGYPGMSLILYASTSDGEEHDFTWSVEDEAAGTITEDGRLTLAATASTETDYVYNAQSFVKVVTEDGLGTKIPVRSSMLRGIMVGDNFYPAGDPIIVEEEGNYPIAILYEGESGPVAIPAGAVNIELSDTEHFSIERAGDNYTLVTGPASDVSTSFSISPVGSTEKTELASFHIEKSFPIKAMLAAATSSTLSFSWTEGGSTDEDIAKPYTISLYKDEACTELEVSFSIPAGDGCWKSRRPKFVFSGLTPATDYWFKAVDTTDGDEKESDIIPAKTEAFNIVMMTSDPAEAGDIILAEDFGEMCWGADEVSQAAGYDVSSVSYNTNTGKNYNSRDAVAFVGTTNQYAQRNITGQTNARKEEGFRLRHWALGQYDRVYIGPGYVFISTSSYGTHILTPPLNNIPDNKTATVKVTLHAAGMASGNEAALAVQHGITFNEFSSSSVTNKNKLDLESNVETITFTGGITVLDEFEVTIEGLVSGDRIAFGPTSQTLSGTKNMMLLTDMTIQIVDLQ